MQQVVIIPDDTLYRRILRYYKKDDNTISSGAYKDKRGKPDCEASVDLARLSSPEESLARALSGQFLVSLNARVAFDAGMTPTHRPLNDNPAHSVIVGNDTKSKCEILAHGSQLLIGPKP